MKFLVKTDERQSCGGALHKTQSTHNNILEAFNAAQEHDNAQVWITTGLYTYAIFNSDGTIEKGED